jgi:FkbM family methyltransferase
MNMRQNALHRLRQLFSVIPTFVPGKTRVAKTAVDLLGNGPAIVTGAHGLLYDVPSLAEPIAIGIIVDGAYEPETINAIIEHMPSEGVFVDVGANIGAISLPIARRCPLAKILSVEACPRIFNILTRNLQMNSIKNVFPVHAFAGELDDGFTDFYPAPDRKFGMGSAGQQFGAKPIRVATRTLDSLMSEIRWSAANVIKLDVEGAEIQALKGAQHVIWDAPRRPVILFESVPWAETRISGQSAGDSINYLRAGGYRVRPLPRSPGMYIAIPE